MDISKAISQSRPGAQWSLNGDTLDGLTWFGPGNPPTMEELEVAWAQVQRIQPPAESYQVEAWMIRGGMDPDLVPQIIAQVVPEVVPPGGINRKEALSRWRKATRVPRDFPLVNVIGAQMGLTPEQIDAAWPEILTL
jgi:hypothetical protein